MSPTPPITAKSVRAALVGRVLDDQDPDAARELARLLLKGKEPPLAFHDFVTKLPGLHGRMTIDVFNCLCDGFDLARLDVIPVMKEYP